MEPELKSVLGDKPRVTEVARGFSQACGPVYSRRGYLLFCDSAASKLFKWQDGGTSVLRASSGGARSLTFDHQGRTLVCENSRVARIEKDGSVTALAAQPEPVDLVYAIDGNIYFSSGARIYRVDRHGKVAIASTECEHPAGVALSPNQQTLYVTDNSSNNVRAFRIAADGSLEKGNVFATIAAGGLGGLKTDEAGRVWVAANGGAFVFSREGKPLGSIPIPGNPNNLNWGEGFRNLFVTAPSSVYRVEARTNGTRTY